MLKQFDWVAKRVALQLTTQYGKTFAHAVVADMRREFIQITPQLPYIGLAS